MAAMAALIILTRALFVVATSKACPDNTVLSATSVPWGNTTWTVCERTVPGGDIYFFDNSRIDNSIVMSRSAEALFVDEQGCYLNFTGEQVKGSTKDLLGNSLIARGGDPSFEEIRGALPPLVLNVSLKAKSLRLVG